MRARPRPVGPPTSSGRYLGSPYGIRTYELLYGPAHRKLMEFIRSVEILKSSDRSVFAVNSYEGSNYTNCYIFRDPMRSAVKSVTRTEVDRVARERTPEIQKPDHVRGT